MADKSKIEWTDATWNPITGCSVVSPGCKHCYAMKLAGTRLKHHPSRKGLTQDTKAGPVWTGEVRFNEEWLDLPLRWRRPRKIFVCAHGDLFAEGVPDKWIDRVLEVIWRTERRHTYQILTKRPARMRECMERFYERKREYADKFKLCPTEAMQNSPAAQYARKDADPANHPNIWLGVSVEDQQRANERIPELLATPAAIRFVSYEPALGPVDFTAIDVDGDSELDALNPVTWEDLWQQWREATDNEAEARDSFLDWHNLSAMPTGQAHPVINWIIAGGESGPKARPAHPDWFRSVRDQCAAAGVAFLFKQWGAWSPDEPEKYHRRSKNVWSHEAMRFQPDGTRYLANKPDMYSAPGMFTVYRHGIKAKGRLLDGVKHNGFPEVRA